MPDSDYQAIEQAGFRAWPALEESNSDGVVLRCSQGHTKRANSANIVQHYGKDFEALAEHCENFFTRRELPCIFRLPSYCNNQELDNFLAARGYSKKDSSLILCRPVQASSTPLTTATITQLNPEDWIAAYCRISNNNLAGQQAHLNILKRVSDTMLLAVLPVNDREVACAMGVISNGYFGIFDLVTAAGDRNKGHATTLINTLLGWAASQHAATAYIQVVADNNAAIKLYEKLGYQQAYQYWYRIK